MEEWKDKRIVPYFDLLEYVDKIKVTPQVQEHLKYLEEDFAKYIALLGKYCKYDAYAAIYYWMDDLFRELQNSSRIEKHRFSFTNQEMLDNDIFFDTLQMSDPRIKKLHKFVCESSGNTSTLVGEYRKTEAWVGVYDANGEKDVYWNGVQATDIRKFTKQFIRFYKTKDSNILFSNPFLKATLAHLLFVRIHPFGDGNGRTARIIQNICFTNSINKLYGTKLKLSPLNISQNIYINQPTYVGRINHIRFNLEDDTNEAINKYFEFMLNMFDEQLYFQNSRIPRLERNFENIIKLKEQNDESPIKDNADKSKIAKKMFKVQ